MKINLFLLRKWLKRKGSERKLMAVEKWFTSLLALLRTLKPLLYHPETFLDEILIGKQPHFVAFSLKLELWGWLEKELGRRFNSQRSFISSDGFCPLLSSNLLFPPTPTYLDLDLFWQFSVDVMWLPWKCYPAYCTLLRLLSLSSFLSSVCLRPHILSLMYTHP